MSGSSTQTCPRNFCSPLPDSLLNGLHARRQHPVHVLHVCAEDVVGLVAVAADGAGEGPLPRVLPLMDQQRLSGLEHLLAVAALELGLLVLQLVLPGWRFNNLFRLKIVLNFPNFQCKSFLCRISGLKCVLNGIVLLPDGLRVAEALAAAPALEPLGLGVLHVGVLVQLAPAQRCNKAPL